VVIIDSGVSVFEGTVGVIIGVTVGVGCIVGATVGVTIGVGSNVGTTVGVTVGVGSNIGTSVGVTVEVSGATVGVDSQIHSPNVSIVFYVECIFYFNKQKN
jgi:hypothetical protein